MDCRTVVQVVVTKAIPKSCGVPLMDGEGPPAKVLLADKGCDADFIRRDMVECGGCAMIPTRRKRTGQVPVDPDTSALRNIIECCFNKPKDLKQLRCICF
jgi:hypothetical protein